MAHDMSPGMRTISPDSTSCRQRSRSFACFSARERPAVAPIICESEKRSAAATGAGAGFDYNISDNRSATVVGAFALTNGAITRAGDFNLQARILARY